MINFEFYLLLVLIDTIAVITHVFIFREVLLERMIDGSGGTRRHIFKVWHLLLFILGTILPPFTFILWISLVSLDVVLILFSLFSEDWYVMGTPLLKLLQNKLRHVKFKEKLNKEIFKDDDNGDD